jgi:predicted nucleotidyltransferase
VNLITDNQPEIRENKELRDLKESLQGLLGDRLLRMALFGSRARGDSDEDSDYDIAVIVRGLTRELKHQILDKVAEIELEYLTPLSALVLSEVEFNRLKAKERRIALDIEREGIPL